MKKSDREPVYVSTDEIDPVVLRQRREAFGYALGRVLGRALAAGKLDHILDDEENEDDGSATPRGGK